MEALYSKLYNKYEALKKKRISELDEPSKEQELNFLNYVSAAEQFIQHLKVEKDKLSAEVGELRNQVTSIRSSKDEECTRYQKLLMEENQKNKMLSKEVEKLQEQLIRSKEVQNEQTVKFTSGATISCSLGRMTRKRSQEARAALEGVTSPSQRDTNDLSLSLSASRKLRRKATEMEKDVTTTGQSDGNDMSDRELAEGTSRGAFSSAEKENVVLQPECCRRTIPISANSTNCQFQALIEHLLGMKFSTVTQNEGICISALHQSSGYSFVLKWVNKEGAAEEPELLYRVSTLGTFERVAPEWMKSVLMFSTSMCPIFFERISRVIKLHH